MINEGIAEGKYIETVDNTHKDVNIFMIFYIAICTSMSNMRICAQNQINQVDFLLQLKLVSLTLPMI